MLRQALAVLVCILCVCSVYLIGNAEPIDLKITREDTVTISQTGNASISREEKTFRANVPGELFETEHYVYNSFTKPENYVYEDLIDLYVEHYEWMFDETVQSAELMQRQYEYKKELTRHYALLLGPGVEVQDVKEMKFGSNLSLLTGLFRGKGSKRTIDSRVSRLVQSEGTEKRWIDLSPERLDALASPPKERNWEPIEEFLDITLSTLIFHSLFLERRLVRVPQATSGASVVTSFEGFPEESPGPDYKITLEERVVEESTTTFILPETATSITLIAPVSGWKPTGSLYWHVELGGGSSLSASAWIRGNTVILKETVIVTEQEPNILVRHVTNDFGWGTSEFEKQEDYQIAGLLDEFAFYRAFRIIWDEGTSRAVEVGNATMAAEENRYPSDASCYGGDWARTWQWTWQKQLEKEWTWNPLLSGKVSAYPKLSFTAKLGWQFRVGWRETWWGWIPCIELRKFHAQTEINPKLTITLKLNAQGKVKKENWQPAEVKKLLAKLARSKRFSFSVGPVPVWLNIKVTPSFTLDLALEGEATLVQTISLGLKHSVTVGATYANGWTEIVTGPDLQTSYERFLELKAGGSAIATLTLPITALIYDAAGPSVEGGPFVEIKPSCEKTFLRTDSFICDYLRCKVPARAGLKLSGKIVLAGWLAKLLSVEESYPIEEKSWPEKPQWEWVWPDNLVPCQPLQPSGPTQGAVNESLTFAATTKDPDGDQIKYGWDWDGDNKVDEWTEWLNSGSMVNTPHTWQKEGRYSVRVIAQDKKGKKTDWSKQPLTVSIAVPNYPPSKPVTPHTWITSGTVGQCLSFSTSAADSEGDQIKYGWDWDGDNKVDEWTEWKDSGETCTVSHVWTSGEEYTVKVKAQDNKDNKSVWSEALRVTIEPACEKTDEMCQNVKGGTLRIGVSREFISLDPRVITTAQDGYVIGEIFDDLIALDPDTLTPCPHLAKTWEVAQDLQTITFHLHEMVKFHNGGFLTANDVAFTFNWMRDPFNDSPHQSQLDWVEEVVAIDDYTVDFVIKKNYIVTPACFAGLKRAIVPESYIADVGDENFALNPIGSGPYKFVEWIRGQHVKLERNEDYWLVYPNLDKVIYRPIPELSAMAYAFETHEIDIADRVNELDIVRYAAAPDLDVLQAPTLHYCYVFFNMSHSPSSDIRFRKAVSYSIDCNNAIQALFPAQTARRAYGSVPFPLKGNAHFSLQTILPGFSPKTAGKLFDELKSEGVIPVDHRTTIYYCSDIDRRDGVLAEAIVLALQANGLLAEVRSVTWSEYWDELSSHPEDIDLGIMHMGGEQDPYHFLYYPFHSDNVGGSNLASYKNGQVDSLIDEGLSTFDLKRRAELAEKIQLIALGDELVHVPLYNFYRTRGVSPRVKDLRMSMLNEMTLCGPYSNTCISD